MLMLFISLYPVFFFSLVMFTRHLLRLLFLETCISCVCISLERGVAGAIDKLKCLAYVCCCVASDSFGKLPFYSILQCQMNKRLPIISRGIAWNYNFRQASLELPFRS